MKCAGCNKNVPFWGDACPFCGEDKSEAQSIRVLALLGILAACGLGYSFWGIGGFILGCLIGAIGVVARRVYSPES